MQPILVTQPGYKVRFSAPAVYPPHYLMEYLRYGTGGTYQGFKVFSPSKELINIGIGSLGGALLGFAGGILINKMMGVKKEEEGKMAAPIGLAGLGAILGGIAGSKLTQEQYHQPQLVYPQMPIGR
ncbi:MAG: hypothetical protein ACO2OV_04615 [Thermoproteota archaeon]|jgi:outer membrane lipoprotein SlyB